MTMPDLKHFSFWCRTSTDHIPGRNSSEHSKTVAINEFMASNDNTVKDEAGEFEDWIELYNLTDKDINMSGFYITDNSLNLKNFKSRPIPPLRLEDISSYGQMKIRSRGRYMPTSNFQLVAKSFTF